MNTDQPVITLSGFYCILKEHPACLKYDKIRMTLMPHPLSEALFTDNFVV